MENLIESISIKNYKGIKEKTIRLDCCIPNHITIIVGKNGVGKSSFVRFLSLLNSSSIKIDESDAFNNNIRLNQPSISIKGKYEGKQFNLSSDLNQNQIFEKYHFDIINSPLIAKDSSRVINGQRFSSVRIATRDVEIIDVKRKQNNPYDFKEIIATIKKTTQNTTVFRSIKDNLLNTSFLSSFVDQYYDLRNQKRLMFIVDQFLAGINSNRTKAVIINTIEGNDYYSKLMGNSKFGYYYSFVCENLVSFSPEENIFNAIQLLKWDVEKKTLRAFLDYLINKEVIDSIKKRISIVNTTNRKVLFTENEKMVLRLPEVKSISNGERDLLFLTARLLKILKKPYKTKQYILVLDEIFDYLDGANLLELQYMLMEIINDCKRYGYKYYILLFTHIDPIYFNSFVLNKTLKINYFEPFSLLTNDEVLEKMIIHRSDCKNSLLFTKKFIHYFPSCSELIESSDNDYENEFFSKYKTNQSFYNYLISNTKDYLSDNKFDIIGLCLYVRVQSEAIIYHMLKDDNRLEFIDSHGQKKLEFAEQLIEIPSIISLLRIVFNEGAHVNENNCSQKKKMLYLRMNTIPVREMIKELEESALGIDFSESSK